MRLGKTASAEAAVCQRAAGLLLLLLAAAAEVGQAQQLTRPTSATLEVVISETSQNRLPAAEGESSPSGVIQALRRGGVGAEAAALILSDQQGGDIGLRLSAMPFRLAGERAYVALLLDIDGPGLLAGQSEGTLRTEIYAYGIRPDGGVGSYLTQSFALDPDQLGADLQRAGLKFFGHLELPPGPFSVRVLVRNSQTGAFGLTASGITVPDSSQHPPLLVYAAELASRWLLVREAPHGDMHRLLSLPLVVPTPEGLLVPAAHAVVEASASQPLLVLAPTAAADSDVLMARVRRPEGEEVAELTLPIVPHPAPTAGTTILTAALEPLALDAGRYILTASLPHPAGEEPYSVTVPLTLERRRSVGRRAPEPERPGSARRSRRRARKAKVDIPDLEKIGGGYRSALKQLAAEDTRGARSNLEELEVDVAGDGVKASLEALRTAEMTVMAELATRSPQVLLPVARLHSDLYRTYVGQRRFLLASHARQMVQNLAESYAEMGDLEEAPLAAARCLSSLAGYLQENRMAASSQTLFHRTLELDPANEAALLALAADAEKYADYESVDEYLRRLLRAHPDSFEGQLRLAINLQRTGRKQQAQGILRRLTWTPAPAWVWSVAYQQVARSLLDQNNLDEAISVLREATERLPEDGTIRIQLAYALDRKQRPAVSRKLVENLEDRTNPERESSRRSYDRWPTAALRESRQWLRETATSYLPALSETLEASTPGGT